MSREKHKSAVPASLEYAMRRRAIVGLLAMTTLVFFAWETSQTTASATSNSDQRWLGQGGPLLVAAGDTAASRSNGSVTHTVEGGEPVVVLRLVPAEPAVQSSVPAATELGTENPDAVLPDPSSPDGAAAENLPGVHSDPQSAALPVSTGSPAVSIPLQGSAATETEAAQATVPAEPRYPLAKPSLKPDLQNGVGGALDLTPPEPTESDNPRPMRLNAVSRPNRSAQRTQRNQNARVVKVAKQDTKPQKADKPIVIDPLDVAAPPRIVDMEALEAVDLSNNPRP